MVSVKRYQKIACQRGDLNMKFPGSRPYTLSSLHIFYAPIQRNPFLNSFC